MNRAVEKAKLMEKEKYVLSEQVSALNLQLKSVDKQVDERLFPIKL